MSLDSGVVEFVQTLSKSEPIGQHSDEQISDLKRAVLRSKTASISIIEPAGCEYEVAEAIANINERLDK